MNQKYADCFLPISDLVNKAAASELSVYAHIVITSGTKVCGELYILLCMQVLLIRQHLIPLLQQVKLHSFSGDHQVLEL